MWTRNKHKNGNFSYSIPLECDKAAEKAHRRILFGVDSVNNMSDDELLAALEE